jgi:predicted SAM-dependent methyltransferase
MLPYLNLGCGTKFHPEWVNIDFVSTGEGVIAHNLLQGVPMPDNKFEAVYHSHVLEHFPRDKGFEFIKECYRVLKPGGVIRIAIPDLEQIARNYIEQLELALKGDKSASLNYDWMVLEMYDQTVREKEGGNMLKYLGDKNINEEFVFKRIGEEGKIFREMIMNRKPEVVTVRKKKITRFFKPKYWRQRWKENLSGEEKEYLEIGRFRRGGEIHQWMYDRFSLGRLLASAGFKDPQVKSAFESNIKEWNKFGLDLHNGKVRKPDSLFMEAYK